MPPRTKLDPAAPAPAEETPAAVSEPTPTADQLPQAVSDEPAPVTHVRATADFTASYGQQLLDIRKGDEFVGDLAVYLSTGGVPVVPVED